MALRTRILAFSALLVGAAIVPGGAAFAATAPLAIDTTHLQPSQAVFGNWQLPNLRIGVPVSIPLSATGGSGGDTWHTVARDLPYGLTLDASDGAGATALHGTPLIASDFELAISVTDSAGDTATIIADVDVLQTTPPTAEPDGVIIYQATIRTRDRQITVAADDPDTAAVLTVTDSATGLVLGTLNTFGSGIGSGVFDNGDVPKNITVTSSAGASATAPVVAITKY